MKRPISSADEHFLKAEELLQRSDSLEHGYTIEGRGALATRALAHLEMARYINERTAKEHEAVKHHLGPN